MEKLLDATETRRRIVQHGAVLAGVLLLLSAIPMLGAPGTRVFAAAAVVLGLLALVWSLRVRIRWDISYKGHTIRFENDPLKGERLYIDDELAARGGLGLRMVLNGHIHKGEGAGDRIEAVSDAGLLTFRCQITAYPDGNN